MPVRHHPWLDSPAYFMGEGNKTIGEVESALRLCLQIYLPCNVELVIQLRQKPTILLATSLQGKLEKRLIALFDQLIARLEQENGRYFVVLGAKSVVNNFITLLSEFIYVSSGELSIRRELLLCTIEKCLESLLSALASIEGCFDSAFNG